MKYKNLHDYDGVDLKSKEIFKLSCCDCNLVHRICIVSDKKGNIGFSLVRDKRATAAKRRKKK